MKYFKNLILLFCSFTLIQTPFAYADIPAVDTANTQILSGSEYYVGAKLVQPLISVKLIKGVARPGVYHVPRGTNLSDLLAYAGGAHQNSKLDEILIRRYNLGVSKNYQVNLAELFASTDEIPVLADKDSVYIETDVKLDNTLRWVSIVSGILTIALTSFLIIDRTQD